MQDKGKNKKILIFIAITTLILVGYQFFYDTEKHSSNHHQIDQILDTKKLDDQTRYLLDLMEEVGPEEAQELLLKSGLPFTGESHFLVHVVGNYVYEQYGLSGLPACEPYFLSACYHGFIIRAIEDLKEEGVRDAIRSCEEKGIPTRDQCVHAVGHGALAWHDYDLLKALDMCDTVGSDLEDFPYISCYDGVFMENLWGVHEGGPSPDRWIKYDDPTYPCNDPRIDEKYLGGCWLNQASVAYEIYKGDLKKTANVCEAVENQYHKKTCYNNVARQIHPLTEGVTGKAIDICTESVPNDQRDECLITIATAAYSVGDKDRMPFEICEFLKNDSKSSCYDSIFYQIRLDFQNDINSAEKTCGNISESVWKEKCISYQNKFIFK